MQPLHNYTYQIISRGKIVESKSIHIPENTNNSHRFKFVPTFDYAPRAKVIVYLVEGEAIRSTNVCVVLDQNLRNYIELNVTPDTAKPGQTVDINVKSNPKSYIGLLGIDQSVLLLRSGNDLAQDEVWNELDMFNSQTSYRHFDYDDSEKPKKKKYVLPYHNNWEDFNSAGLILFTNTQEPIQIRMCYKMSCDMMERAVCFGAAVGSPMVSAPKVRKEFPETWLWESIVDDR